MKVHICKYRDHLNSQGDTKMGFNFTIPDYKKIRVIIDTDAACEADDPFAIVHGLLSPKLIVKGIVAEHFKEAGSMERSYDEIPDTFWRISFLSWKYLLNSRSIRRIT